MQILTWTVQFIAGCLVATVVNGVAAFHHGYTSPVRTFKPVRATCGMICENIHGEQYTRNREKHQIQRPTKIVSYLTQFASFGALLLRHAIKSLSPVERAARRKLAN